MEKNAIETREQGQQRNIAEACVRLAALDDAGFHFGEDRSLVIEEDTTWVAWGWRLAGQEGHQINSTIESLISNKPRLKFFLAYKALTEAFEMEQELKEQGQILSPPSKEWRESLVNVLMEGVEDLARANGDEKGQRLSMYREIVSRSLVNVDLIDINRLDKDNPAYTTDPVGESFLTLSDIERVGGALEKALDEEDKKEASWRAIAVRFEALSGRRAMFEDLRDSFLRKI